MRLPSLLLAWQQLLAPVLANWAWDADWCRHILLAN